VKIVRSHQKYVREERRRKERRRDDTLRNEGRKGQVQGPVQGPRFCISDIYEHFLIRFSLDRDYIFSHEFN
jgi:hypothetical protein